MRYHNDGEPLYFMGSADWMTRNLMRRVEVATPVEDPALQAELDLCLTACLEDSTLWQMQSDGRYVKSINEAVLSAQRHLGVEGSLSKKEDLPLRASVVGVQVHRAPRPRAGGGTRGRKLAGNDRARAFEFVCDGAKGESALTAYLLPPSARSLAARRVEWSLT